MKLSEHSSPLLFGSIAEIIKGLNIVNKRPWGLIKKTGEGKKGWDNVNQYNTEAKCQSPYWAKQAPLAQNNDLE